MVQGHTKNEKKTEIFLTFEVLKAVTIKIMTYKMEYSLKTLGIRFLYIISKFL
jgi:hypothetical protein